MIVRDIMKILKQSPFFILLIERKGDLDLRYFNITDMGNITLIC